MVIQFDTVSVTYTPRRCINKLLHYCVRRFSRKLQPPVKRKNQQPIKALNRCRRRRCWCLYTHARGNYVDRPALKTSDGYGQVTERYSLQTSDLGRYRTNCGHLQARRIFLSVLRFWEIYSDVGDFRLMSLKNTNFYPFYPFHPL